MALRGASTTVDSDRIDWEALAKENAAVVCTVKSIEPETDFGNGAVEPVKARIIVLTGSHAGEVWPDEMVLKKGIRIKLDTVGDDVVGRVQVYGDRKAIGLNAEWDGDLELAEKALAKASGKKATASKKAADDGDEPPF